MVRLQRYIISAPGRDNDSWKALLEVHSLISMILEEVLTTDFRHQELASLIENFITEVRIILQSNAVCQWVDAVKRKWTG